MKHVVIAILVLGWALPAMAVLGLPIAEEATTETGQTRAGASLTFGDDINLYGGRISHGLVDGVALFGGIGILDPDGGDSELYYQVGGKLVLPVDLPVDLAFRGAFGLASYDERWSTAWGTSKVDVDLWSLSGGLLASKALDPMITVYGFVGLSHSKAEARGRVSGPGVSESFKVSDSNTDPALAVGGLIGLGQNLSLFGEVAHIDDVFVSLGARYAF